MGDNEDDKPFACTAEGCGMRFINEDHLTVHKRKHDMSLNLTASSSIKNNSSVFVDQTPTPTRFIRNCEEVGLFLDLQNVNPFDEQFKKAVEIAKAGGNSNLELNGGSDSDTLNTPSVLPSVIDSDLVVSTTTCTDNGDDLPATRGSSSRSQSSSVQPSSTTVDSEDEDVCIISASLDTDDNLSSENSLVANTFLSAKTRVIKHGQSSSRSLVTQSPLVSTATSNSTQVLQIPTVISTAGAHLSSTLPTTVIAQPTSVITSATTVVQLLLKLPDGRSVPVQIPTVPLVSSAASVAPITTQSNATTSTITSLAKMKLKETLIQNQQSSVSTISSSNMRVMSDAVELLSSASSVKSEEMESALSPDDLVLTKRRRTSEDDSDEKRRRFLERNRAAATRCRIKRKHWIQSLEKRADDLSSTNQQLLSEVKLLRNEVAKLKTLLLAHKDCPVTLQQQHAVSQVEVLSQPTHIILDSVRTIQITSAEAIASTALTNMAHTITTEPTHILPIDIVVESDDANLMQENNDIDK